MRNLKIKLAVGIIIFALIGIGFTLIYNQYFYSATSKTATTKTVTTEEILNEAQEIIETNTIYATSDEKLLEGALKGMAQAINDPYSTYFTEEEAVIQKQSLAAERFGIGLEFTTSNEKLIVVAPIKNSPAEKAGIISFDELVQINGVKISGKPMDEVMKLFQGQEGEAVELVVFRPSIQQHLTFSVKREKISNETVHSKVLEQKEEKIGYVELSLFAEKTADDWLVAIENLKQQEVEAIIVDVRDNPGGYLHAATGLLSTFQPKSTLFGYMENAEGALEKLATKKLKGKEDVVKFLRKTPIAILQNGGSASASEVFIAALTNWQLAVSIGEKSFGKGTVQETWSLSNGGELKLSTHKWLTSKKVWIHGVGITPQVEQQPSPLSIIQPKLYTGSFVAGDFGDEIQYVQSVLKGLGYSVSREDGYFDESTEEAVQQFRENEELITGKNIDDTLFQAIVKELQDTKGNDKKDPQLQIAISYLINQIQ